MTLSDAAIEQLGAEIVRSCPAGTDSDSNPARDACASALANVGALDGAAIGGAVRWGGVKNEDFEPTHHSLTTIEARG